MRNDRNMKLASELALVAVALGIVEYAIRFGLGLAFGFTASGAMHCIPLVLSMAAIQVAILIAWCFLASSTLNGARLLLINVAIFAVSLLMGLGSVVAIRVFHDFETVQSLSSSINLVLNAVAIAVFAILVSRNAGRARAFLSMFLAAAAISFTLRGLIPLVSSIAVFQGKADIAFVVSTRILSALAHLLSTAAWLLAFSESHVPPCGEEGREPDQNRIPRHWRAFIVALPILAIKDVPGISAMFALAPAGIFGLFIDSNPTLAAIPYLLTFGYAAYLAAAAAIVCSRTRKALLFSVLAALALVALNIAGCRASMSLTR